MSEKFSKMVIFHQKDNNKKGVDNSQNQKIKYGDYISIRYIKAHI